MKVRLKLFTWVLAILAAFMLVLSVSGIANAAVTAPATEKNLHDNGDGTYTLSLSVTGQAESSSTTEVTKANVILVLDTSTSMINNNTRYNGQTMTRLNAEKRVLTDDGGIIDSLLAQNVPGDPVKSDIIEVAIVNFGTRGTRAQDFTTNATTLKSTVNGLSASQGTNWQEGLMRAEEYADAIKTAQPDEEVYIIFLTDGEPTTHYNDYTVNINYAQEWAQANGNARTLVTDGYHFYGIFTWGSGTSSHYLSSLVQYAYTGSGNSNTALDPAYDQFFTDATDTEALIEALNQITHDITQSVGFTEVEMTDGTTAMTTSNVKTTASGEVTNMKYYRGGGSYGTFDPDKGQYGTEWTDAPHATVNASGEVDWDLGNIVLEDGVTYTCTFVVWPSQESLDLVADLNNGIVDYDSLTPDQKSQISVSGGKYFLKTNTDYPSVTYSTVTTTTVDGVPTTVVSDPITTTITNPDPVGLAEEKLNALKIWEDSLDPSQREDVGTSVTLYLKVDGHYYYVDEETGEPMGVVLQESEDWEKTDYIAIAPGIMVTADSPAYDPAAPQVTYDGVTYAIIEAGHDYVFEESETDKHFELTAYTHHPMIMGENTDGTPHIVDVIFNEDGTIKEVLDLEDSLSATNTLKGGINISKVVVDETGAEVNDLNPFTITVTLTDPDGNALPTKTVTDKDDPQYGTTYTIDYRIYYGPNNPNYDAASGGGRSDHIYATGTSFTETIYVGDVIRVVNVEDDTVYTVTETAPTGYEYVSTTYEIAYAGDQAQRTTDPDHTVQGNSASYAEVTNKYTYGSLEVSKTVEVESGDEEQAKAAEFEFTFKLYSDNTKATELTGNKYNYTITKADGTTTDGTITEGGTFVLKDGDSIEFKMLPEAAYYEITETAKDGYTVDPATGVASGTIVKNEKAEAEFTNTYSVEPVSVDPPVKKEITGTEELYNKGDFTFTIANTTAPQGVTAPLPENTSITNSSEYELEDKPGYYEFGEIVFSAPGTYEYKVTESGSVEGVVNDPAASKGKTITFTVTDEGDGTLTVSPTTDQVELAFTNTYEVTTVTVEKVWKDNNDEYKTRPGSIEVQLLADGEKYGAPMTLDEPGEWTYTWEDLPIYSDATGATKIKYTVDEVEVEGYATTVGETTGSAEDGYEITVTNSNVTIPTNVTAFFKKTVTSGNAASDATFGFTIASASAPAGVTAPMPDPATGTASYLAGETGDKPISTGTITFTEPGTYTYTVTETDKPAGWTATGSPATVTVVISKADDGTLTAEVTGGSITNTYAASGEAVLEVTKATDGADWPVDESGEPKVLTFTLSGTGGTLPETKTATLTAAGTASFAAITYTQADVANSPYTYTISEDGFGAGWTPTPASGSITAKVTLTDDGAGNITAEVVYSPEDKTITNTYDASGSIELEAKKAVSGAEWPVDENGEPKAVTFTLSGTGGTLPDDPTITLTNGDAAKFGAIEYTLDDAGETYTYTITETTGFGDGWTPSGPISVSVEVVDNGDGTLTATPTYDPDTQAITNTYDASGEVTLEAKKALEGREWMEGESYTFTLFDSTGTAIEEIEVTEDNADSVQFETISYGLVDAGKEFTYTISETTDPLPAGVTKSADIEVTVEVVDNGDGTLTATPTYTPDTKTITNTYTPDPVKAQITVDKEISGYIAGEDPNGNVVDRTFTVTMTGPKIDGELTVEITTENGTGSATFDEIEYTADDMVDDEGNRVTEKEFTYEVTETAGTDAGFTYDDNTYEVVVTVTDDSEQGKLVVTGIAMVDDEKDTDVTIVNEFEEEGTEVTLTVNKEIDDQSGSAKDATFKFTIAASEPADAPLPDPTTIEITTSGLKGGKDFAPIEFTESGTYKYTIKEEVVDPAPTGWTYDDHEYEVVIVIDDDFEVAELVVSQKTVDGEETEGDIAVTFTNVYKAAETKATLVVNKEVEDTSGSAPDIEFEFTLAGDDPLPEVTTGKTKAGGSVEFGPITYEKVGDYNYTITETAGDGAGWTYDTNAYPVVVTVTDEGGQLVADVVYNKDESLTDLTVTNIYKPKPATATPKALKTIDDQSNSAPNETFTFNLLDSEGTIVETKTRENGGPVEFTALPFEKVGTYEYVIQEVAGSTKGYTYDIDEHKLTIEVEDKGGELVATVTYEDGEQALITNVYKAEPVKVPLKGVKVLDGGKKLEAGEFTFELTDNDSNKVDGTFTNDAEGNIDFGSYTFEKVGTYTYTATEVEGDNALITYDTTGHKFTIEVKDDGGQLVAEVTGDEGELVKITNVYTPEPVLIDPPVTKVITGDKPDTPATFTFQMKAVDPADAPMPAGSADGIKTMQITGAGTKEFGDAEIGKPGVYVYEITELKGNAEGYTYDTTVYTLTVTVTQNDEGILEKEEVYTVDGKEVDSVVFTNKYEKPKIPTTGDTTPQIGMLALAGAVITGIAAYGARRRED